MWINVCLRGFGVDFTGESLGVLGLLCLICSILIEHYEFGCFNKIDECVGVGGGGVVCAGGGFVEFAAFGGGVVWGFVYF